MPQITGAIGWYNAAVEYSLNGSSWTDISGAATSVKVDDGTRDIGEVKTMLGDFPIVTQGKRNSQEIGLSIVYTEGGSDAFEVLRALFDAGTNIYLRWAPKGNTAGNRRFSTGLSPISKFGYPQGDSNNADPVVFAFSVKANSGITDAAVP